MLAYVDCRNISLRIPDHVDAQLWMLWMNSKARGRISKQSWQSVSWPKHGGTLLHTIKEKYAFAVPYLVKAGTDIDGINIKGDTSLMVALKQQRVSGIHELLKCRALKDICNNSGRRAID